jgi:hypothetical protein
MTIQLHYTQGQLDALHPSKIDGRTFMLAGEMDIPCRVKLNPDSDTLFVMLNGAVGNRAKVVLPVFARWNWGKILGGHVLAICDPTLYLNDELRLGWFLGTAAANPYSTVAKAVQWAETRLGIAPHKVVFYGSSGGGFASLLAAAQRQVGRVIAINPQTDIVAYHPPAVDRVARVFDPGLSAQAARNAYGPRWSAIQAVEQARQSRRDLRVLYVQNVADTFHHEHHFLPFCERFALPTQGGTTADGAMLSHLYDSPEGHGAEPPEIVKYITTTGMAHLAA